MRLVSKKDGEILIEIEIPDDGFVLRNKKEKILFIEALNLLGSEMEYKNIGLIKNTGKA